MVKLRELRARHNNMTQAQLAELLDVHPSTVSYWEKDINKISSRDLRRLCELFGVSADELLGIKEKGHIFLHRT